MPVFLRVWKHYFSSMLTRHRCQRANGGKDARMVGAHIPEVVILFVFLLVIAFIVWAIVQTVRALTKIANK